MALIKLKVVRACSLTNSKIIIEGIFIMAGIIALSGLIITLVAFAGLYFMSLKDESSDHHKEKVQNNTDYDGMGTFSRYVNK